MDILINLLVFMPIVGAFLSYIIGRKTKNGRDYFMNMIVVAEFVLALVLAFRSGSESGIVSIPGICGMGLHFTLDGFRGIYCVIAAFMWMVSGMFSPEYFAHYRNRNRYYFFLLITLGATEAIFLSADLYTTFVFFEVMSLASYVWVAQDEKEGSLRAASTYLAVAVIGGLVMLMGLFLLYNQVGTLMISELPAACEGKNVYAAAICMLVGFGGKAGAYPIHIWLPKAHPVAPAPASALLSGILTKTGIFGILVITCKMLLHDEFWGVLMLTIGVITMFLGALLAVFSIDFKRTLACSSVSQIGFILVGVGMIGLLGHENTLAVRGTFLHMVNHSTFKLLLFLVAGVIFMNVHKLDLNDIRGFGRQKPLLMFLYLMGALGIGGIPIWSGYISKTLLHESIVEYIHGMQGGHFTALYWVTEHMQLVEWIFLISGGLTLAYMCKLFVAVFLEKNADAKVQKAYEDKKVYIKPVNAVLLTITAVVVLILGALPTHTMDKLADMAQGFMGAAHAGHAVNYFTWVNLKGSVISIVIGVIVYVFIVRGLLMKKQENGMAVYVNRWPRFMDLEDYLYRPLIEKLLPAFCGYIMGVLDVLVDGFVVFMRKTVYRDSVQKGELDEGNPLTHVIGLILNSIERFFNKTIWRSHPHEKDFEHEAALKYASFKENMTIIGRSLSYGLILFCLGLCATLLYLLVTALR